MKNVVGVLVSGRTREIFRKSSVSLVELHTARVLCWLKWEGAPGWCKLEDPSEETFHHILMPKK